MIQFLATAIRDAAAERGSLRQEQGEGEAVGALPDERSVALQRRSGSTPSSYKLYVKPVVEAERH